MSVLNWTELTLTILSIVALIAGGIKLLTKHYFDEIKAEFKPNGGSSLKDQVNRLEARINEADIVRKQMKEDHKAMKEKLDHMYEILLDYISRNSK
jgi:hypothetical protein